jgi:hypothetical protein
MKLPEFAHTKKHWDTWKAFHVDHRACHAVQFDTGELVIAQGDFTPDQRRLHKDLNIAFVLTTDKECKTTFIDPVTKEAIPKGWLDVAGGQTLMLDMDTCRAVRLDVPWGEADTWKAPHGVPARFYQSGHGPTVYGYFAGPGRPPCGGPVSIDRTLPLTKEEREEITGLRAACRAWVELKEITPGKILPQRYGVPGRTWQEGRNVEVMWEMLLRSLRADEVLGADMAGLDDLKRLRLANNGVETRKEVVQRDYLTF